MDPDEVFDPDDGLPLDDLEAALPITFSASGRKLARTASDGTPRLRKVSPAVADRLLATIPLQSVTGQDAGLYTVFAGVAPSDGVSVGYFDGTAMIASLDPPGAEGEKLKTSPLDLLRSCLATNGGRDLFDRGLLDQEDSDDPLDLPFDEDDGASDEVTFEYDEGVKVAAGAQLAVVPFISTGAALRAYRSAVLTGFDERAQLLRLGSVVVVSLNDETRSARLPTVVSDTFVTCGARQELETDGPRALAGPAADDF